MNSKASATTLFQKRGSGGSVSQTPEAWGNLSPRPQTPRTQALHTGLGVTHFSTAWGPGRQQKPRGAGETPAEALRGMQSPPPTPSGQGNASP